MNAADFGPRDLALFPYGTLRGVDNGDSVLQQLALGTALVMHGRQQRLEAYDLERTASHWRLFSRLDDEVRLALAIVPCARLTAAAETAGFVIVRMVWASRLPSRLRLLQWPARITVAGADHSPDQIAVSAAPIRIQPCLVSSLRAEGRTVQTLVGPMGTTEHLLLLERP